MEQRRPRLEGSGDPTGPSPPARAPFEQDQGPWRVGQEATTPSACDMPGRATPRPGRAPRSPSRWGKWAFAGGDRIAPHRGEVGRLPLGQPSLAPCSWSQETHLMEATGIAWAFLAAVLPGQISLRRPRPFAAPIFHRQPSIFCEDIREDASVGHLQPRNTERQRRAHWVRHHPRHPSPPCRSAHRMKSPELKDSTPLNRMSISAVPPLPLSNCRSVTPLEMT